ACALPILFAGNVSFRLSRTDAFHWPAVSIVLATAVNGASHAMVSSALRSHDLHARALETAGTGGDPIFSDERVRTRGHVEQVRDTHPIVVAGATIQKHGPRIDSWARCSGVRNQR